MVLKELKAIQVHLHPFKVEVEILQTTNQIFGGNTGYIYYWIWEKN